MDPTTFTAIFRSRNSWAQSSSVASVAPTESGNRPRVAVSATSSTPGSTSSMPPRNASATALCTSSVSAALHTEGRWVLALVTMRAAISRSADSST